MERIGIVGLSLRQTDVQSLERVRRPASGEEGRLLRELADEIGASELVLIPTCNRVEVVFAREEGHLPCRTDVDSLAGLLGISSGDALRDRLHLVSGRGAARHLFRVASSLDSVVLGEDQILGQVRNAFELSRRLGMTGRLLGPLFHQTLQVGKQVRTETELSRHPISVVSVGLSAIASRFSERPPRFAILGAGHMARLAALGAESLGFAPALIVNRSLERARTLAEGCGARAIELDRFRSGSEPVDALLSATSAPDTVLDRQSLLRVAAHTPSGQKLVAVDVAMPRDLEPVRDPRVEVIDLDQLHAVADENRATRARAAARAEELVEAKLGVFCRRSSQRVVSVALAELENESAEILERELQHLGSGRLEALAEDDRRAVERWARATFGRLSHAPISTIKRLAADSFSRRDQSTEEERLS